MKKYLLPLIIILCLVVSLTGYSADLFGTYDKRIKLTVSNANIDAELTWFPVTVFLASDQGEEVFAEFDADEDFDRVAFTTSDESTQIYADCELFDLEKAYISQYPPAQSDTYVKATTKWSGDYWAYYATDPARSLTGGWQYKAWLSANGTVTNQRFHIDLGSAKIIKRIYYENAHTFGGATAYGVQNFTFWGSNTEAGTFDDLVYANDGGWTELTVSQNTLDQHSEADEADPKYITVTNSTKYRYYAFKFADNYGSLEYMGVRRIELQIGPPMAVYHVSKTGWAISNTGTTDFYMYYNNTADHNTTYISKSGGTAAQSVWDGNFKAVYHMVDATTSTISDSTSNNNDGTKKAANEPIETTGKVGLGQTFDGTDDYINLGNDASLNLTGSFTQEALIYITDLTSVNVILQKDGFQVAGTYWAIGSLGFVDFYTCQSGAYQRSRTDVGTILINTWYHLAVTRSGTTVKIYINGVDETTISGSHINPAGSVNDTRIGVRFTDVSYFKGIIDEVPISNTAHSAAWVKATYNSLWDTLLTYGSEETAPPPSADNAIFFGMNF